MFKSTGPLSRASEPLFPYSSMILLFQCPRDALFSCFFFSANQKRGFYWLVIEQNRTEPAAKHIQTHHRQINCDYISNYVIVIIDILWCKWTKTAITHWTFVHSFHLLANVNSDFHFSYLILFRHYTCMATVEGSCTVGLNIISCVANATKYRETVCFQLSH